MGISFKKLKDKDRVVSIKFTNDDWYSNEKIFHKGELRRIVTVSLLKLNASRSGPWDWRVCVWGNDDFGLEKDFTDHRQAVNTYIEIVIMNCVNQRPLRDMGFVNS